MTNKDVIEEARKEEIQGLAGRGIAKLIRDLVMCKDCKHWINTRTGEKDTCGINCIYMHDPDFFCSCGEKIG